MKIILINYGHFVESSGIHIFHLANSLEKVGVSCIVTVPKKEESVFSFGYPLFETTSYTSILKRKDIRNGSRKDVLIHSWTPRENVRRITCRLSERYTLPYCVHLEDNEEHILSLAMSIPYNRIRELPRWRFIRYNRFFINPYHYQDFLKTSSGITYITEDLQTYIPEGIPSIHFVPACEQEFFSISEDPDYALREALNVSADAYCITYTGNVHHVNAREVSCLYEAVGSLNEKGYPVKILRTGSNYSEMTRDAKKALKRYSIELGRRQPHELIKYISAADFLVQPGGPGAFNDYRLPSKLPMYLASGRPVILPKANIGKQLDDTVNCLLTKNGSTEEIEEKILFLIGNYTRAREIGRAGREFALRNFSWEKTAREMISFYENVIRKR